MEIDREAEKIQPNLQNSDEDVQFDANKFNEDVRGAIEQYKANNSQSFQSWPTIDDLALLLHILLKKRLKICQMDCRACKEYLTRNQPFSVKLYAAYASRTFTEVVEDPDMPLKQAQEPVSGLSSSSSTHGLQEAFEQPYMGDTAKLFINTLDRERRKYAGAAAAKRPYNWSIEVIQSSGMGKSRMVEEASKTIFSIPINIREKLPDGKMAYPPPDPAMRQYFHDHKHDDDAQQQKVYTALLVAIFTEAKSIIQTHFSELAGEELANAWADHLKIGQSEEEVGPKRREFYEKVVQTATRIAREIGQRRSKFDYFLRKSWEELAEFIRPNQYANECFVYFDEAHSLAEGVEKPSESHQRSPYHNLGTVLSKLAEERVFFIFLSANSSLKGFAPSPSHHPSERVTHGAQLIPPFTELPYDIYEHEVLKSINSLTLTNVCKTAVLVGFGRIIWYARYKSKPNKNPFIFALDKLSGYTTSHEENAILAALGVRIGITFDRTHHASYSMQSKLVESHLRVVYSIPQQRACMHTGFPSEPILAEAASRYLNGPGFDGVAVEGAKMLSMILEKGLILCGERGEIAGRLLITSAHDIALGPPENLDLESPDPQYHRPIPVLDFLCALFHEAHHTLILGAMPMTDLETQDLRNAFSESFVFFSHFALAEDSEMLSVSSLATALVRGMAIQAMDGQASIDAVIPIHMGSLTTPISSKTTSAINLQFRNRKKALDCYVNRSITVPNVEMPAISIIFEFGVTENGSEPVTISREPEDGLHGDDRHYQIVAYGCNHTVFRAIPEVMDSNYESILRGHSILQDFPRYEDQDNKEAFLALRPANCGKRQHKRYSKLMELETGGGRI